MVYGSLKSNKSINIEYVSANPTGQYILVIVRLFTEMFIKSFKI